MLYNSHPVSIVQSQRNNRSLQGHNMFLTQIEQFSAWDMNSDKLRILVNINQNDKMHQLEAFIMLHQQKQEQHVIEFQHSSTRIINS